MREIKFRGKRIDNGEWVYGDLLTKYIHHKGMTIVENGCIYHEVDPETVGEFLNLTDKNNRKVYAGDTFSEILEDCYVGWCDVCKRLQVKIIETGECMACLGDLHWYELIELLTEGKVWVNGNIGTQKKERTIDDDYTYGPIWDGGENHA